MAPKRAKTNIPGQKNFPAKRLASEEPEGANVSPTKKVKEGNEGKKRNEKKKKPSRKTSRETADASELQEVNANFAALAASLLQSTDNTLRNTRHVAELLSKVKLHVLRKQDFSVDERAPPQDERAPPQDERAPPQDERALVDFLKLNPIVGRDLKGRMYQDVRGWHIFIADAGSSKFLPVETEFSLRYDVVNEQSLGSAQNVANQMVNVLNVWPQPVLPPDPKLRQEILELAVARALGPQKPRIHDCRIVTRQYHIEIPYYDPVSLERRVHKATLTPSNSNARALRVPELPDMTLLRYERSLHRALNSTNGQLPHDWYLSATKGIAQDQSSTSSQHLAQNALRYLALQCTGKVVSAQRMEDQVAFWQAQLGFPGVRDSSTTSGVRDGSTTSGVRDGSTTSGKYSPNKLHKFRTHTESRSIFIGISKRVSRDIIGWKTKSQHFKLITIKSLNASRATPVLDSMWQNYNAGMDVLQMLVEAAMVADEVNLDILEGVPPTSICECDEFEISVTLHACEGCGNPTLCRKRSFDRLGRLVCMGCFERSKVHDDKDSRHPTSETLVQYLGRLSILRSLRHECSVKGIEFSLQQESTKSVLDIIRAKCSSTATATSYVDQYTQRTEEIMHEVPMGGGNPSKRRLTPTMLSVDAIFPVPPPGSSLLHSENNVELTSVACQYAKWRSLPGVVHEIAQYLRLPLRTEQDQDILLDSLEGLQQVRIKRSYAAPYDKAKREMVSGKPTPGESGPHEAQAKRFIYGSVTPLSAGYIWNEETRTRLGNLADQIAKHYGKPLVYTTDGAPWIGPRRNMPNDFNWNSIWTFCEQRLQRMRKFCNKYWKTRETSETLYAEIIFQFCTDDRKYGDMMGLPLALTFWNPLRLSVAHRIHGRGMRSGWPLKPGDISERVDADNNMLIETWYTNCTKQDIDENYYDKIVEILRSINIPKAYYDPTLGPPVEVDEDFASAEEVEEGDTFAAEQFNSNAGDEDGDEATIEQPESTATSTDPTAATVASKATTEEDEASTSGAAIAVDVPAEGDAPPPPTEIDLLLEAAQGRRQEVITEFSDLLVNDERVVVLLGQMVGGAREGDRETYNVANMELSNILYGGGEGDAEGDIAME